MECLLESVHNAKGNPGLEALRQRHVYFTMQHIIKRQNSYVVIYKKIMLYMIPKKCYDVWMPQSGCSPYHIQELFFFMEKE